MKPNNNVGAGPVTARKQNRTHNVGADRVSARNDAGSVPAQNNVGADRVSASKSWWIKGELKEKAEKLGWVEKGVLAMNYFPTLSKKIAGIKLREILKSRLEGEYEHWFGETSKFYASYYHYSKEQKALIDGLMKASQIQKLDGYLDELEKKKVSKRTFASLLYPTLVPEVAAKRMDLVLERNFKALWKVYLDEEELDSPTLNLKQCYKIAQILKSEQAIEWVRDRANIRFTKETPKEGESDGDEKRYLKKEVVFFLTQSNNYTQARYQFNKLINSKPGLTEKIFPTVASKKTKYLSQAQVDCLIQEFPELKSLCANNEQDESPHRGRLVLAHGASRGGNPY